MWLKFGLFFTLQLTAVNIFAAPLCFDLFQRESLKNGVNALLTPAAIKEQQRAATRYMGVQKKMFGTTIYHHPFDQAEELPNFPGVRKDAKAVILAFGGAGTLASTGRTWMRHAKVLDEYRLNVVSFDYPFHGTRSGQNDQRFMNAELFLKQILEIVDYYLNSGKPIIFFGHSFGATIIKEILFRRPDLAYGKNGKVLAAILASPGGSITPQLMQHYRENEKTILAKAYSDDWMSDVGGNWVDTTEKGFKISDGRKVRHSIPIRIISGDKDLLNTVPLLYGLKDTLETNLTEVVVLPEVTHQIFYFRGQEHNILIEDLLGFAGRLLGTESIERHDPNMNFIQEIRTFAANSSVFRTWMQMHGKKLESITKNAFAAKGAIREWSIWYAEQLQAESKKILSALYASELEMMNPEHLQRVRIALEISASKFNGQHQIDLGEFILWAQQISGVSFRLKYRTP